MGEISTCREVVVYMLPLEEIPTRGDVFADASMLRLRKISRHREIDVVGLSIREIARRRELDVVVSRRRELDVLRFT